MKIINPTLATVGRTPSLALRPALFLLLLFTATLCLATGCTAKFKKARHLSRADKYYAAGQYAKAEIEYLNVIQADAANAHAFARLGSIYYDEGRSTRAFAFLKKASELNPNDMNVQLKLGTIYL